MCSAMIPLIDRTSTFNYPLTDFFLRFSTNKIRISQLELPRAATGFFGILAKHLWAPAPGDLAHLHQLLPNPTSLAAASWGPWFLLAANLSQSPNLNICHRHATAPIIIMLISTRKIHQLRLTIWLLHTNGLKLSSKSEMQHLQLMDLLVFKETLLCQLVNKCL